SCRDAALQALGKLSLAVVKCHQALATARFSGKQFDEEACETTDPLKSALSKFNKAILKLAATANRLRSAGGNRRRAKGAAAIGCRSEISDSAMALATQLTTSGNGALSLDDLNGAMYCDATSGILLDSTGDDAGYTPASKNNLKCSAAVAGNFAKLVGALVKCRVKAASAAATGKVFDEGECRSKPKTGARPKYDKIAAKLAAGGTCPQCLGFADLGTLGD